MLHAFARGALSLGIFRFLLGIGESGNWPAAVKVVAEWFPVEERSIASGIFNSGSSAGAILAPPIIVVIRLGNAFTVSAWLALNTYPWNWVPIVNQSEDQQVGYFFGIDAFGHVGFKVAIDGVWQTLTSKRTLPLKRRVHVTGAFDGDVGLRIFIDEDPAGILDTLEHSC
jgi:MFS family permease